MAGDTLAQKIIARAAGLTHVAVGDDVTVRVDLLMAHDGSGPRRWRPRMEALGGPLWDPEKVVLVTDHYVPAEDQVAADILQETRDFARDYGVQKFFDMEGICHAILPEKGLLKPGMFVAGGDSHTTMGGAYACYAAGFGATDTTGIAITGETWTTVPETILVQLNGQLNFAVTAKDIMLRLCRELGMDNSFKVIEYTGSGVANMAMAERTVLSNMAAELGAETGLIGVDGVTIDALAATGVDTAGAEAWASDADAQYSKCFTLGASGLEPQIAAPHSPVNSDDIGHFIGTQVDQCYIGACVGAKLTDLHMAAAVLRGRKVAPGTTLIVAPSTSFTMQAARADGTLRILEDAGATFLPSGCGACAGFGGRALGAGAVCLSTTNRNFKGRMGHANSRVYLGSAYAAAAAAVTGEIT
ncbi:MAG: aconitase/3-isopropylmalate dehydratase large subunit family protein, partial [Pseudomonadota bacterium]